ncbi:hypothetical protein [Methylomagnum sp.]
MQILGQGGFGFEGVAATTMDGDGPVGGMNVRLHKTTLPKDKKAESRKLFMLPKTLISRKAKQIQD